MRLSSSPWVSALPEALAPFVGRRAGWDGALWDVASGREILVLRRHEESAYAAAFSPDGTRIVSGSAGRMLRVSWVPRSKQELIETALVRLPRELTEEERRRFHLSVE